jgi:hypothetical protein
MNQFEAARDGDLQQLRVALTAGNVNDVDGNGWTALHCCILWPRLVRQLLYRDGRQCKRTHLWWIYSITLCILEWAFQCWSRIVGCGCTCWHNTQLWIHTTLLCNSWQKGWHYANFNWSGSKSVQRHTGQLSTSNSWLGHHIHWIEIQLSYCCYYHHWDTQIPSHNNDWQQRHQRVAIDIQTHLVNSNGWCVGYSCIWSEKA